jgi:PA14 domain
MIPTELVNYGNVVAGSADVPHDLNPTYFYARFSGYLVPTVTGKYTIGVNCADGCNLFVGDQPIVVTLGQVGVANATADYTQSAPMQLTKGIFYPLTLEWHHGTGTPYELQLLWTPPLGSVQIVPAANMSNVIGSVSGLLNGSWWNGTSGLWYPGGNGTIDFSNSAHANKNLDNIPDGAVRKLYTGSGNGTFVATAGSSFGTAPAGDVVTTDGSGNAQDSGTLLSSLLSTAGGTIAGVVTFPNGDLLIKNGSFGTTISTAATANWTLTLPTTAGTSGYVLQTDGAGATSWTTPAGAAGVGGNGVISYTAPVLANFSWVNQGTASATQVGNTVFLTTPAVSGDQYRSLVKVNPTNSVTAWFIPLLSGNQFSQAGIILRDSVSGKMVNWAVIVQPASTASTLCQLTAAKLTNNTTFSANYATLNIMIPNGGIGLKFRFVSGTRYFDYSFDGLNWTNLFSVSNTDFITPNQVGFYTDSNNTVAPAGMTLLSYVET